MIERNRRPREEGTEGLTMTVENSKATVQGGTTQHVPYLVSWNTTKRCNLRCSHCYLDSAELDGRDDTSTDEALKTVDEIASLNPNAMLILTGGEPLLRYDICTIAGYASKKGLTVLLGTNGTMLDDARIAALKEAGVKGVGVSLDSAAPAHHDRFRGVNGSWQRTIDGIEALRRNKMDFQVQVTVTRENREDLPAIIDFSAKAGARALNVFFLVCTGRGQNMTDLSPEEYEEVLNYLASVEKSAPNGMMVRARCAPHFLRVVSMKSPENSLLKGNTSGCIAGTGYMRISPEGYVTPCPYMPPSNERSNLSVTALKDIWGNDPLFLSLREPAYKGKCAQCEFDGICGGCRARALATSNDAMGEDPWCAYIPGGGKKEAPPVRPVWTEGAQERLSNIPAFLRPMIRSGLERYARSKGISEITPELMAELKKKAGVQG